MEEFFTECFECDDSGWRTVECDGELMADGEALCRRTRRHLPHEFVRQCECRPINRHFQAKRERRVSRVA